MLVDQELAQKLHNALAQQVEGHGRPTPISNETTSYAQGIIASLKAAVVSNLPGTITGITSPGGPLSAGAGTGGIIAITPGPMLGKTLNGFNPASGTMLSLENMAIIAYIGTGLVTFASGNITGSCTSTPVSPGPLVAGTGVNGQIVGLTGAGATAAVLSALGTIGPDAIIHYTALIDYILASAAVSYATGNVQGGCPSGGGALINGSATGGIIL